MFLLDIIFVLDWDIGESKRIRMMRKDLSRTKLISVAHLAVSHLAVSHPKLISVAKVRRAVGKITSTGFWQSSHLNIY